MRFIFIVLILIGILVIGPVEATYVTNINYETGVFTENDNFELVEPKVPEEEEQTPKTISLGVDDSRLVLEKYPLVALKSKSVDLSFSVETAGTNFTTELENAIITFDGERIATNQEEGVQKGYLEGKGSIKVSGQIPDNLRIGEKVSLISFKDAEEVENNRFVVYVMTDEYSNSKVTLYEAYNKWGSGDSLVKDEAKKSLLNAMDEFKKGNYIISLINADHAITILENGPEWFSRGYNSGIGIGIGIAIIASAAVGIILFVNERRSGSRRLENLITKYYELRKKNIPISSKWERILQRSTEFTPEKSSYPKSLFQLYVDDRKRAIEEIDRILEDFERTEKSYRGTTKTEGSEKRSGTLKR